MDELEIMDTEPSDETGGMVGSVGGDIGDDLVEYQSDPEFSLETNQLTNDINNITPAPEIRIVLQEGVQSKEVTPLEEDEVIDLYKSLGIPLEESDKKFSQWRLNVVHIRGVQDMNTNDVLAFFNDYEPDFIEWVNDLSCNVLFSDSRAAATALSGLTIALVLHKSQDNLEGVPDGVEVVDANDIEFSVPPNRWRLGKSHDKAKYLLLRFASSSDKKMPGARKHSKYYEKYGLPDPSMTSEKVKIAPRITISNPKLTRNITRTINNRSEFIEVNHEAVSMKMRADEEEAKTRRRNLEQRLGTDIRRRVGTPFKHKATNSKGSVWDRLQTSSVHGSSSNNNNRNNRTVKISNQGLRVFSRLGKHKRSR